MRLLTTAALALALTSGAVLAEDSPEEIALEARKGFYQMLGANMAPLAGMAKGEIPYDAEVAGMHAGNIEALSRYTLPVMHFPAGTAQGEIDGTEALPAIWANFDDFKAKYAGLQEAAVGAGEAAKGGQEALGPLLGKLGGACKACHDSYRAK